ncbi:DUF4097 family beta strand repeat-containing protein [Cryptosporangium aurantiacum]|uniref:Putative adhesin n=1 Tax=Cryptosporangium aurantiacum TaxID=134849 RepID=A0A1M7RMA7_9ACTN|nr:DUF4097 family beta strand repeat-containing protein [Cryptosporangium aurantiacum]SHN47232.1 Putative adhesin [Cryptosporangium aurantiacum]
MTTFATPAPIAAELNVPAGRVQFVAADRTDTTVEVRPADASKNRDVKAAERTTVDYADGVLRIQAPAGTNALLGATGSVEVTVQLPAGSRVRTHSAATEFRAIGRLGEVSVEGAYQAITIDEATSVQLTAIDGSVEIGRLNGPAQISTQRGDIRVVEAAGPGTVELTTQSGNIQISAAAGVSASLDAGTGYGRVSNALKNDGVAGLEIRATTSHGDITARSL